MSPGHAVSSERRAGGAECHRCRTPGCWRATRSDLKALLRVPHGLLQTVQRALLRPAPSDALVETDPRSAVDMNMMHAATVCADAAAVHALEPPCDLAVLAPGRHEVDRAARGVVARFARAGDARAAPVGGDDANASEFLANLVEAGFQGAGQATNTCGLGVVGMKGGCGKGDEKCAAHTN